MAIRGTEGLAPEQIHAELAQGGRFVVFSYCVSIVVMSFKRTSEIHYLRPGEGAFAKALPYALLSLCFGWWGFPWGIIYTIQALSENASGGRDVTPSVMARR